VVHRYHIVGWYGSGVDEIDDNSGVL